MRLRFFTSAQWLWNRLGDVLAFAGRLGVKAHWPARIYNPVSFWLEKKRKKEIIGLP